MKAGALIELLQQVDPETEVLIRIGDLSDLDEVRYVRLKKGYHTPTGIWFEYFGRHADRNDTPFVELEAY